jgi:N-acetylglucosamine kinase-like BadF-type ATPase
VVSKAAGDGDEVARHILFRAGGALARLSEAVFRSITEPSGEQKENAEALTFSRSGSLWQAGIYLCDVYERSVLRFAPSATIGDITEVDAALGALEIARELS